MKRSQLTSVLLALTLVVATLSSCNRGHGCPGRITDQPIEKNDVVPSC